MLLKDKISKLKEVVITNLSTKEVKAFQKQIQGLTGELNEAKDKKLINKKGYIQLFEEIANLEARFTKAKRILDIYPDISFDEKVKVVQRARVSLFSKEMTPDKLNGALHYGSQIESTYAQIIPVAMLGGDFKALVGSTGDYDYQELIKDVAYIGVASRMANPLMRDSGNSLTIFNERIKSVFNTAMDKLIDLHLQTVLLSSALSTPENAVKYDFDHYGKFCEQIPRIDELNANKFIGESKEVIDMIKEYSASELHDVKVLSPIVHGLASVIEIQLSATSSVKQLINADYPEKILGSKVKYLLIAKADVSLEDESRTMKFFATKDRRDLLIQETTKLKTLFQKYQPYFSGLVVDLVKDLDTTIIGQIQLIHRLEAVELGGKYIDPSTGDFLPIKNIRKEDGVLTVFYTRQGVSQTMPATEFISNFRGV